MGNLSLLHPFYCQPAQRANNCNTFCFASSETCKASTFSSVYGTKWGSIKIVLWVLFLSRGDSEELTWQSLDLTTGGVWTTSSLLLCHDCFGLRPLMPGPQLVGLNWTGTDFFRKLIWHLSLTQPPRLSYLPR